jgi:hypothetical protein
MELQPNDMDTALDVRRGLKKLHDLPTEERIRVATVLRKTTGAQFADMAKAKEKPRHPSFRYSQHRR